MWVYTPCSPGQTVLYSPNPLLAHAGQYAIAAMEWQAVQNNAQHNSFNIICTHVSFQACAKKLLATSTLTKLMIIKMIPVNVTHLSVHLLSFDLQFKLHLKSAFDFLPIFPQSGQVSAVGSYLMGSYPPLLVFKRYHALKITGSCFGEIWPLGGLLLQ